MVKALKRLCGLLLLLLLLAAAALGWQGLRLYRAMEAEEPLSQRVEEVRAQDDFTPYSELPRLYVDSVVAIEDSRFWSHPGVDPVSILRALIRDVKEREWAEGGSTITQQLAKNLCFDQDKRLTRKAAEVFAARALEKNYSKQEIFELYVNSIYFGNGWYNVRQAAAGYFGAAPSELTALQCTELACYPNAPSVFMDEENGEALEERRQEVVERLLRFGYISEEEAGELR
ncbi:MAG: transglycosylase domain-containing protein [Firmicutes bacterium]|nr:transglycosylase domain-containing protein [Bacillota bacterium]